jgi:hypothetical protein
MIKERQTYTRFNKKKAGKRKHRMITESQHNTRLNEKKAGKKA